MKKIFLLVVILFATINGWGAGTDIADLNFNEPTSLPSSYTYSSSNTPVIEAADGKSCINLSSGGGCTAPTFSADNSSAPTGGKRWIAFQPAEDCTVTFKLYTINNSRTFYLLDKDHSSTSSPASSFVAPTKETWYNSWSSELKGGTWYAIIGSGSNCYIASMQFTGSTPCAAPTTVTISGNTSYEEGEALSLTASYSGGTGTPSYQWYKNGISESDKIAGANTASYTKASCSVSDAGDYYCMVSTGSSCSKTNETGYTISVTALPPSSSPTISVQPVSATYEAGETVIPLNITASGSGTLSYQWQKDGTVIPGANSNTYLPTESGIYTCIVTNKEAGKAPVSLSSSAANIVIKTNSYYLQTISPTGSLSGDFYTTAGLSMSATASYEGVDYTKALNFAGNASSWSSYPDRVVRYDCKTTKTKFTIIAYNSHNSTTQKLYVGNIIENAIGSANSVSTYDGYDVPAKSQVNQSYEIDNSSLTPRSLYVSVGNKSYLGLVQIIAEEVGTPLPIPGSVSYKVNFNKTRIVARQDAKVWLDSPEFEYCVGTSTTAGTQENTQLKTKGTHYIRFTNNAHSAVKIGISGIGNGFYIADDKDATLNVIEFPKEGGSKTYVTLLEAGTHYIVPNGSNIYVTSLELTPAYTITFNSNGGAGTMANQIAGEGATQLNENLYVRPGYQFGGWALNPEGTGVITEDEGIINVTSNMTLYATWRDACHAIPDLKVVAPQFSIWNGKKVDMRLVQVVCDYDTSTVKLNLKSATPISGCTFKYYDSQIHIIGTPSESIGAATTKNVTFTLKNSCDPEQTFDVTVPIIIYPASSKPRLALLLEGTEPGSGVTVGDFYAYTTSQKTKCQDLIDYLSTWYEIVCVNGYATKDEAAIANFYKDFDLLIVTDFMETPKGYTNAIGTLIDKKPILSFEAYVAGENGTNWHIDSNPKDPDPKQADMKVLCAGHSVFKDVLESDEETVNVLSTISGKGLQGFEINDAPDFMFLATVANGSGKLIVCCERQVVFPARLMLYCINFNEMGNLTAKGQLAMKQMIEYLLITDESDLADCALVFDDHAGTGVWSDPGNWWPGYNIIPSPYHPTRIEKPCTVDTDEAHASSIKINVGEDNFGNPLTGSITILPNASLTVAGFVNKVRDKRYATLLETDSTDIEIQSNSSNTGALVYGNKSSEVGATVQYYSKGSGAPANPVWQYIGIPLQAGRTAIQMYYAAWMCRWSESTGLGELWKWVTNDEVLVPFEGYCITQSAEKTYTLKGKLNAPIDKTLRLTIRDTEGYAFAANSWTAPIKIKEMADDDFENAEKTIYIYHTGSYANWTINGTPVNSTVTAATSPGQYAVVPIHAAKYVAGADSVIPSMQGFFVKTTGNNAKLQLIYKRVVYDSEHFKTSTSPLRAPSRVNKEEPEVMRVVVSGNNGADQLYLLSRSGFSNQFEDGWDGRKIEGDTALVPTLAVIKEAGNMAVAAIPSLDERELSFRAGSDSAYTFSFNYEGETIYLYDRLADLSVEIKTGNTYSFTAENKTPAKRFLITKNPPRVPTDIEDITVTNLSDAEKCIIDGQLYIIKDNRFYDARGVRVTSFKRKEVAP